MAPSFDGVFSSLSCVEDCVSAFDDNGYYGCDEEFEEAAAGAVTWERGNQRNDRQNNNSFSDEDELLLPMQSEEFLSVLLEKENQHLPHCDYTKRLRNGDLDLGIRKEAVDSIAKAHSHFSFGPLSAYLSISYLDRFLSAYDLPKGKDWMTQLLAVACLSLAAKIDETEVPLSLDLQVAGSKFVFEARTIQRMELLVLSTLRWRMQSVTPFSFLDHFLRRIIGDKMPPRNLLVRSIQLILNVTKVIDFLEFRPSEVAAAVAISVVGEAQLVDSDAAISLLTQHVRKARVLKCIDLIHGLALITTASAKNATSVSLIPQSPIGVLDAACLSYKSDETAVGSCANSSHNTPDTKRRKTDRSSDVE